jgi:hypothetical protein
VTRPWHVYPVGVLFGLRVRYGERGGAAVPGRRARLGGAFVLRDHLPDDPVHCGNVVLDRFAARS